MKTSAEFIIALIAASIFVFESNKEKTLVTRFTVTIVSAAMGFSLAPDLSVYVGGSLVITGLLVTAFGFLFLEMASALLSDIPFIKEVIKKRFGK